MESGSKDDVRQLAPPECRAIPVDGVLGASCRDIGRNYAGTWNNLYCAERGRWIAPVERRPSIAGRGRVAAGADSQRAGRAPNDSETTNVTARPSARPSATFIAATPP
jgi:hypothetical protein